MTKISLYPLDTNIQDDDLLIGTDKETPTKFTKNFSVGNLKTFINSSYVQGLVGPAGPQGVQGPIGLDGPIGPVGPAGLTWQGQWVSGNTYYENDAVGFDGASYFLFTEDNVGSQLEDPVTDTNHWALLASQGAQGPAGATGAQGPQGEQGPSGLVESTSGLVYSSPSLPYNILEYDINKVTGSNGQYIRLPENAPKGKVITVSSLLDPINIKAYNNGVTISVNNSSSNTNVYQLYNGDTVKLTSLGTDYWQAEIVSGTNIIYNGKIIGASFGYAISDFVPSATTTPLSLSTLNSSYPNSFYPVGTRVPCINIPGGGIMYTKTGFATWVSSPITAVV